MKPSHHTAALHKRKKTSFAGDVFTLGAGTTFAQFLSLLAAPVLTRLYAPEAFGLYAVFISITGILGVIACMRYELSILLPESDAEAANLFGVSLGFVVIISVLVALIVWFGGESFLHLINTPGLTPYLWLVPVFVFINGLFFALNYWNTRTRHFGRLSVARITSSFSTTTTTIGAGFAGYPTGGSMIGARVFGQSVAVTVLAGQTWRYDWGLFKKSIRWREMLYGLKRHRKFPIYSTWGAFLNTASWQVPAFILAAFFSSTVVGYYALGFRILQLPMSIVGRSIGQVFFQRAAEARIEGKLDDLVAVAFKQLVKVGLFPTLMLTIVGSDLYTVVFGENWAEAGVYTQILSIWGFFWFISSPLSTLFSVLEKQDSALRINVVIFSTRLISLFAGGYLGSPRIALVLFSASGVLVYGYMNFWLMHMAGVSYKQAFSIMWMPVFCFLPVGAGLIFLKIYDVSAWGILFISLGSIVIYFLYSFKQDFKRIFFRVRKSVI